MAPKDKARAAGISYSSFMELGAELEKAKQELTKNKAAGKANAVVAGTKKPDYKVAKWAKQNAGVQERAARDAAFEEMGRSTYEDKRAMLEMKAKKYDLLKRGKTGGYTEEQYSGLLVDFDQKRGDSYESDSDDVDESLTVPAPSQYAEEDPIVEYQDEFGRTRTAPRSEVPREHLSEAKKDEDNFDPFVVHNPINHFPTWEPSAERRAKIEEAAKPVPLETFYDASLENRAKAGGSYNLSSVPEIRKQQLAGFTHFHEDTKIARKEAGAVDVRPGEVVGMRADEVLGSASARSRAVEKRKLEVEERRKAVEAKRRKKSGMEKDATKESSKESSTSSSTAHIHVTPPPASADPFAALEAQAASWKGDQPFALSNVADAFLAQLERDIYQR